MKIAAKRVEDYLRLPYTIRLRQYEDATFFADVAELPGCMTEADTSEEALEMIRDAMAGWIEVALSEGLPIPDPATESEYSGRFLVRTPNCCECRAAQPYRCPRRGELLSTLDFAQEAQMTRVAIRARCRVCNTQVFRIVRPEAADGLQEFYPGQGKVSSGEQNRP